MRKKLTKIQQRGLGALAVLPGRTVDTSEIPGNQEPGWGCARSVLPPCDKLGDDPTKRTRFGHGAATLESQGDAIRTPIKMPPHKALAREAAQVSVPHVR